MENLTTITKFILLGFSDLQDLQILHFVVFLTIYLTTLMGNILLILTVTKNDNLHSPMYFFLANLSLSDACLISTTVPKSLVTSMTNNKWISFSGCVSQVFLVLTFAGAELFLLAVMAYDRYVAICYPLQYNLMMNWNSCLCLAAVSWITSMIHAAMHTANTFRLDFCQSNVIGQFFSDIPQLIMISCSNTFANEMFIFATDLSVGFICFLCIFVSYGYIFSTVFKIQSVQGRYKAFSTCIPHLTVFCLFILTCAFSYLRPMSLSSPTLDLLTATLYTVVPPLMNPIIYSLRNKGIQVALWKMSKAWIPLGDFKHLFQSIVTKKAQQNC